MRSLRWRTVVAGVCRRRSIMLSDQNWIFVYGFMLDWRVTKRKVRDDNKNWNTGCFSSSSESDLEVSNSTNEAAITLEYLDESVVSDSKRRTAASAAAPSSPPREAIPSDELLALQMEPGRY
ncbi:hypothetical protein C4D60_Mb09t06470 [Musa balbisiana]|uniref:Uncharacterized protein n=1 Tax=Musa balbisiana TaxID=52838 RepID=A0A4S8IFT0_MUSBA|nr:hypothetical protein C4D60_Mb09t06470 [Musa balbisiana]